VTLLGGALVAVVTGFAGKVGGAIFDRVTGKDRGELATVGDPSFSGGIPGPDVRRKLSSAAVVQDFPRAVFQLKNSGGSDATLRQVNVQILEAWTLKDSSPMVVPPGGAPPRPSPPPDSLEVSLDYEGWPPPTRQHAMPKDVAPGKSATVPMMFTTDAEPMAGERLYLLQVSFDYDNDRTLIGPKVLISIAPIGSPFPGYASGGDAEIVRTNVEAIDQVCGIEAKKSARVKELQDIVQPTVPRLGTRGCN
jgi:hypothetical protein